MTHTGYVRMLDKLGLVRVCASDDVGSAVVFDGHYAAGEENFMRILCAFFAGERIKFWIDNDLRLCDADLCDVVEIVDPRTVPVEELS